MQNLQKYGCVRFSPLLTDLADAFQFCHLPCMSKTPQGRWEPAKQPYSTPSTEDFHNTMVINVKKNWTAWTSFTGPPFGNKGLGKCPMKPYPTRGVVMQSAEHLKKTLWAPFKGKKTPQTMSSYLCFFQVKKPECEHLVVNRARGLF